MAKILYKSRNRVLCGVCGGIADFLNMDPTIVRLIMIALVFAGFGIGIAVYIIAALIMPEIPKNENNTSQNCSSSGSCVNSSSDNCQNDDSDFDNYFKKDK